MFCGVSSSGTAVFPARWDCTPVMMISSERLSSAVVNSLPEMRNGDRIGQLSTRTFSSKASSRSIPIGIV